LFAAIRNKFIDHCRRERIAWAESLDTLAEVDSAERTGDENGFKDPALSNGRFESALNDLRPEERAVLYLMLVEGYTAQSVADLFEWPRGTVLSMSHRARQKVRASVNGESVDKR
jgi:RNA polymerase sigma-70 factor (ECF subfamily)